MEYFWLTVMYNSRADLHKSNQQVSSDREPSQRTANVRELFADETAGHHHDVHLADCQRIGGDFA